MINMTWRFIPNCIEEDGDEDGEQQILLVLNLQLNPL